MATPVPEAPVTLVRAAVRMPVPEVLHTLVRAAARMPVPEVLHTVVPVEREELRPTAASYVHDLLDDGEQVEGAGRPRLSLGLSS
jgi:hypothetical protein